MAVFMTGGLAAPQHDEHTLLLIHGENIVDSSMYGNSLDNHGVIVSDAQSKFGGKSLYFNGSSAYLKTTDFAFGSGDFTIDWWEYCTGNSATRFASSLQGNYGGIALGGPADTNCLYVGSSGTSWDMFINAAAFAKVPHAWVHWALVRHGNSWYTFKNGQKFWEGSASGSVFNNGYGFIIGSYLYDNTYYFGGYMDEIRVSDIARWTSSFTLPDKAYRG